MGYSLLILGLQHHTEAYYKQIAHCILLHTLFHWITVKHKLSKAKSLLTYEWKQQSGYMTPVGELTRGITVIAMLRQCRYTSLCRPDSL